MQKFARLITTVRPLQSLLETFAQSHYVGERKLEWRELCGRMLTFSRKIRGTGPLESLLKPCTRNRNAGEHKQEWCSGIFEG